MEASDERSRCRCYYSRYLKAAEAELYIETHLEEVGPIPGYWGSQYRCPLYGKRWLLTPSDGKHVAVLRTYGKVCDEAREALRQIGAVLLPDDAEVAEAVETLLSRIADRDQFDVP